MDFNISNWNKIANNYNKYRSNKMIRPKVYLCARVSDDAHVINNKVADMLSPFFDVFVPHQKEAELRQPKDPIEIYKLDVSAMNDADICVAIAPYGKDCSWEMGYVAGQKKPVFMYVPDMESMPLNEWMISGCVSVIITDDDEVFDACQSEFNWLVLYSPIKGLGLSLNRYYQNGGR